MGIFLVLKFKIMPNLTVFGLKLVILSLISRCSLACDVLPAEYAENCASKCSVQSNCKNTPTTIDLGFKCHSLANNTEVYNLDVECKTKNLENPNHLCNIQFDYSEDDYYYNQYGADSCCGQFLRGTKYLCKQKDRTNYCNLWCFDHKPGRDDSQDWVCNNGSCKLEYVK